MEASRSWWRRGGSGAGRAGVPPARRALLLLLPATFFQGYDDLVLGLSLPLIAAEFGLTPAQAGLAVSAIQVGSFGLLALLPLADRVGRRPVLLWTIVGYTVATAATATSRGVAELVAYQFVARACLGTEYALATIAVVELVPAERRGRALGLLASMSALGMAGAGGAFLAVATLGGSWRVLYAVGAVPLAAVAGARRRLPETAPPRGPGRPASVGSAGSARVPGPRNLARVASLRRLAPTLAMRRFARALRSAGVGPRPVVAAAALSFLFAVYPTALTTFATLLVVREWGIRPSDLDPAHVALWIGGVSGFLVAGRLADRFGRRPTSVAFLLGAAAAGLLAFRAVGATERALGLAAVIFGLTGTTPLVSALTTEPFPPEVRGRVGAVTRTAGLLGASVAPGLTGALAGATGSVGRALSLVALSYALAVPAALALPEPGPEPSDPPERPDRILRADPPE